MRKNSVFVHAGLCLLSALVLTSAVGVRGSTPALIATNAMWKYNATGATNLGTTWRTLNFDDANWLNGNGVLGFGESYIATTLPAGNMTYYFRRAFTVTDDPASLAGLTLRANYDDGFVVYLNGQEVARRAMPAGAISPGTAAFSHEGGEYETIDLTPHLHELVLGTNVLAVEVHQLYNASSDLVFDAELVAEANSGDPLLVVRAPYLQMSTPHSIIVRWRTNLAVNSCVRYGTAPNALTAQVSDSALTTEHVMLLDNLAPETEYYYAIGTTSLTLAGGADYIFKTNPPEGAARRTRVWLIGDAGLANNAQFRVRDAYHNFTGNARTDLFMLLGDNAYTSGTDGEYQTALFDVHPATLRQAVLWPVFGNHESLSASSPAQTGVFYDIFSLPAHGEAGGVASGTEAYYSFNYSNLHFVFLNSYDISRAPNGAMLTWLQQDLAANHLPWTIALWHHPPYSKGSHDSDTEIELVEMRENVLPILEAGGVDLIFSGHSHSYERSYLLDRHYGTSTTLTADKILDGGDGRTDGTGAYSKAAYAPASHQGAVYVVAGSSALASGGALNHPAMYQSLNVLGSVVLEVNDRRADVTFLDDLGATRDYFTLLKGVVPKAPPAAPSQLTAVNAGSARIDLNWTDNAKNETGFTIERQHPDGTFAEIATVAENVAHYSDLGLSASTSYSYRVRAFNQPGASEPSNVASATTASAPHGTTLIAPNAVWQYHAGGTDLGTAWRAPDYDDATWASGSGALGFGESYINTTLPTGRITYYFRHAFVVNDDPATYSALNLLANYDDGFVAYLNGHEIARRELPSGAMAYATLAASHEGGAYEKIDVAAQLPHLVAGVNVLAVEVHQAGATSSDLVFDLELNHEPASSIVAVTMIPQNSLMRYNASGLNLEPAWVQTDYDDAAWPQGHGVLGFGENYVATTLPAGQVTYYFRKAFTFTGDPAALIALTLRANYDDGFVAYLNGVEVARRSLPSGPITLNTTASSHEGGEFESLDLTAFRNLLVSGGNVLAVELHQNYSASSDLVLDVELIGLQETNHTQKSSPRAASEQTQGPRDFALEQNYPNPFNPATQIRFHLPHAATMQLAAYTLQGELAQVLFEGPQAAGTHVVRFAPRALASGVYLIVLQAEGVRLQRQCVLVK